MADVRVREAGSIRVNVGDRVEDLDTPLILADLDQMERNISDWQSWMDDHGVKLRVHVKTHKVPEIALMQLAAGADGICCAKISEAEPFAASGVTDIALAYPIFGEQKWARIAEMAASGVRMTANCDSEEGVRQASAAAAMAGAVLNLQIDVDSGMARGGIPLVDVDKIEALARAIISLPGVEFDGLTTHRSYFFADKRSREDEGHTEGAQLVAVADALRARGIEVREVNAGGSFTGKHVAEVPGITEVRAGTYVFYDVMHVAEGSCTEDQLALTALCRVVSRWGDGGLTIDGGSKTFSGDRGVVGAGNAQDAPPAMTYSTDGRVVIERLTEEHGMGHPVGDAVVALGERLRFYPFHACTCCNLTNEIIGVRDGRVETIWKVAARGLRT
jgi:D-serine deaminase-like pyridoxal phosphate-dependent protein